MECINRFEMRLKSIGANEAFARSAVSGFAVFLDPTVEELEDIKTAVSEAVTNSIVHGYEGDPNNYVYLEVSLFDGEMEIIVKDNGVGIADIEKAEQPFYTTKPEDERSGMGITLMKTFMDECVITSEMGQGTTVKMIKKFKTRKED